MIKNITSKYSSLFLLCILSVFFGGCEGGTGDIRSGEAVDSLSGEILPDLSGSISKVVVTNGLVTVDFSLQDKDGNPVTGQTPSFAIAQLQEATTGEPTKWQSYINKEQTVGADGPGISGTTSSQGSVEKSSAVGTLVDHGDGSYTYTYDVVLNDSYLYKVVLNNITSPLPVTYNPALTHRVAIQLGGHGDPAANLIYDFRPAGGIVNTTRKIVKVERCNDCHGELQAMHGGSKVDVDYCVVCHNPGSGDPNSGNSVDFTVMMHKLHSGKSLSSVAAGGEYAIWGYKDSKNDYSDLVLPMDMRNCRKCHDENDADTPDANQWQTIVTMEACRSCHDA